MQGRGCNNGRGRVVLGTSRFGSPGGALAVLSLAAGIGAGLGMVPAANAAPLRLGVMMIPGVVQPPAEAPKADPPATPGQPARPDAGDPLEDPAVERIIGDLERAAEPRRAIDPVLPPSAVPARPTVGVPLAGVRRAGEGSSPDDLVPEGTYIPSRRGRMAPSEAGEWVFHFDNDTSGRTEPPMVLLPCRTLMAMEEYALRGGEGAVLSVTGPVFIYHGRNYLLPTFFQPARRTDEVMPLQ